MYPSALIVSKLCCTYFGYNGKLLHHLSKAPVSIERQNHAYMSSHRPNLRGTVSGQDPGTEIMGRRNHIQKRAFDCCTSRVCYHVILGELRSLCGATRTHVTCCLPSPVAHFHCAHICHRRQPAVSTHLLYYRIEKYMLRRVWQCDGKQSKILLHTNIPLITMEALIYLQCTFSSSFGISLCPFFRGRSVPTPLV